LINKTIVTLDKNMRHYQCVRPECRKVLFRYGAFHHEFSNKRELRNVSSNIFKPENVRLQFLTEPQGIGKKDKIFGTIIHNAKCKACGVVNKFTVIFGKRNDFKIG